MTIAFNPVSIGQAVTGYIDGIMGSCLIILFLCLPAFCNRRDSRFLFFIIGSIVFITNLKFTGIGFVCLFLLIILIPYYISRWFQTDTFDKLLCRSIILAIFLSLVVGINPYIHNIRKHYHPFYPLAVVKKNDTKFVMGNRDPNYKKANVFQRFAYYYLTPFGINYYYNPRTGINEIFVNHIENDILETCRYGFGWATNVNGDLFIIPLAFSILLLPFVRDKKNGLLLLAIGITVLINPNFQQSRYSPQLWLFPLVVLGILMSQAQQIKEIKIRMTFVVYFMLFLLLLTEFSCLSALYKHINRSMVTFVRINCFYERHPEKLIFAISDVTRPNHFNAFQINAIHDCFPLAKIGNPHGSAVGQFIDCPAYFDTTDSSQFISLNEFLRIYQNNLILISVKDEIKTNLSDEARQFFVNAGALIDKIPPRGSYAAILKDGKIVEQKYGSSIQDIRYKDKDTGTFIRIISEGYRDLHKSSIYVQEYDYARNVRGLNLCALDENGQWHSGTFNTSLESNPTSVVMREPKCLVKNLIKLRFRQFKKVWLNTYLPTPESNDASQ
jgi:hypothetical protein